MFRPSWRDFLTQKLQNLSLQQRKRAARVAVVGVGDTRGGDLAAGLKVARRLRESWEPAAAVRIVELDKPFDTTVDTLRSFDPDLVLLIDAVAMQHVPGTIRYLDWHDTIGLCGSLLEWSPHEMAGRLIDDLDCEVALVGIQPCESAFGVPLSADVRRAVDEIVEALQSVLHLHPAVA
jgi:hydrogenase maturation protease